MADGDKAEPPIQRNRKLNLRSLDDPQQVSYFFNHQVDNCLIEQHKVLGAFLAEKEREAQITYEKPLAELFGVGPQIDNAFAELFFDSNVRVKVDDLIGDLVLLASDEREGSLSRLLDFLFATRQSSRLLEEQQIRNFTYDLYDGTGKFGSMAALSNALSESMDDVDTTTAHFALTLSLIASDKQEMVITGLYNLAKSFSMPWDAVILSRFHLGAEHECTKKLRSFWLDSISRNRKFGILKLTCGLNDRILKEVAAELLSDSSNKKNEAETMMLQAYRCLAITLAGASPTLPDLDSKIMVTEVSSTMRAIFVTFLGWGFVRSARLMVADISKRVPPSEVASDICQICIGCYVDLVEQLFGSVGKRSSDLHPEGIFTFMANKWLREIRDGMYDMEKLKKEKAMAQKVVFTWVQSVAMAMRQPLEDETDVNDKLECAFIAAEFLPEMLRWACKQDGEKLRLLWPEYSLSISISDRAIVMPEAVRPRGRSGSVVKSAVATSRKEESGSKNPQQQQMTEKKEEVQERPVNAPVQDVRTMANQQQQERQQRGKEQEHRQERLGFGQPHQQKEGGQSIAGQQASSTYQKQQQQQQYNQRAKGDGDHDWRHQGTQDVRRNSGGGAQQQFPRNQNGDIGSPFVSPHSSFYNAAPSMQQQQRQLLLQPQLHCVPVLDSVPSHPRALLSRSQERLPPSPVVSASSSGIELEKKQFDLSQLFPHSSSASRHAVTHEPVVPFDSSIHTSPVQSAHPRPDNGGSSPPTKKMKQREVQLPVQQQVPVLMPPLDVKTGLPDVTTPPPPLSPKTPRPVNTNVTEEMIKATMEKSLAKTPTEAEKEPEMAAQTNQCPPASPAVAMNLPSQQQQRPPAPTMGVPAAEARRRSSEQLQQLYEQRQSMDDREQEEMEKRLEDNAKEINQTAAQIAAQQQQLLQPPLPSLITAAPTGSPDLTQLTPDDATTVLPPTINVYQELASVSSASMLTPITEASQEKSTTTLSESDAPQGLANVSTDSVFAETSETVLPAVHVSAGEEEIGAETVAVEQPLRVNIQEMSPQSAMKYAMMETPTNSMLNFNGSSGAPTLTNPSPSLTSMSPAISEPIHAGPTETATAHPTVTPLLSPNLGEIKNEEKEPSAVTEQEEKKSTVSDVDAETSVSCHSMTEEKWNAAMDRMDVAKTEMGQGLVEQQSAESVQQVQPYEGEPKADPVYEEWMQNMKKNEQEDEGKKISPEPNEINRLFQGSPAARGESSLPQNVMDEMAAGKAAAAAAAASEKPSVVSAIAGAALSLVTAPWSTTVRQPSVEEAEEATEADPVVQQQQIETVEKTDVVVEDVVIVKKEEEEVKEEQLSEQHQSISPSEQSTPFVAPITQPVVEEAPHNDLTQQEAVGVTEIVQQQHLEATLDTISPIPSVVSIEATVSETTSCLAPSPICEETTLTSSTPDPVVVESVAVVPVAVELQQPSQPLAAEMPPPQRPIAPDATEQTISAATAAAEEELDGEIVVREEGEETAISTISEKNQQLKEITDDIHPRVTVCDVQERVTPCGVAYKFSPSKTEEPLRAESIGEGEKKEMMTEEIGETTENSMFLSSMLDFVPSLEVSSHDVRTENEEVTLESASLSSAAASFSVVVQSETGRTLADEEIGEHAAERRVEASEHGDAGSDMGCSTVFRAESAASEQPYIYSVPSSAITTPEPYSNGVPVDNVCTSEGASLPTIVETPLHTPIPQTTLNGASMGTMEQQQQPTQSALPVYRDPFDNVQQQQQAQHQSQQHNPAGWTGGDSFGSTSGTTVVQSGGDEWAVDATDWGTTPQPQQQQTAGYGSQGQSQRFGSHNQNQGSFGHSQTPSFGTGGGQSQSHGFGNQIPNQAPCFGTGGGQNQAQGFGNQSQQQSHGTGGNQGQSQAPSFGTGNFKSDENAPKITFERRSNRGFHQGSGGRGRGGGAGRGDQWGAQQSQSNQSQHSQNSGFGGGGGGGGGSQSNEWVTPTGGGDAWGGSGDSNKGFNQSNQSSSGQQFGGQDVRRGGGQGQGGRGGGGYGQGSRGGSGGYNQGGGGGRGNSGGGGAGRGGGRGGRGGFVVALVDSHPQ